MSIAGSELFLYNNPSDLEKFIGNFLQRQRNKKRFDKSIDLSRIMNYVESLCPINWYEKHLIEALIKTAIRNLKFALPRKQSGDAVWIAARSLFEVGEIIFPIGDYSTPQEYYEKSTDRLKKIKDLFLEIYSLYTHTLNGFESRSKKIVMVSVILLLSIFFTSFFNERFFSYTDFVVYVTDTGECYHYEGCRYLLSKNKKSLSKAKKTYRKCSFCSSNGAKKEVFDDYFTSAVTGFAVSFLIYWIIYYIVWRTCIQKNDNKNIHMLTLLGYKWKF